MKQCWYQLHSWLCSPESSTALTVRNCVVNLLCIYVDGHIKIAAAAVLSQIRLSIGWSEILCTNCWIYLQLKKPAKEPQIQSCSSQQFWAQEPPIDTKGRAGKQSSTIIYSTTNFVFWKRRQEVQQTAGQILTTHLRTKHQTTITRQEGLWRSGGVTELFFLLVGCWQSRQKYRWNTHGSQQGNVMQRRRRSIHHQNSDRNQL